MLNKCSSKQVILRWLTVRGKVMDDCGLTIMAQRISSSPTPIDVFFS